jgi:predicted GIY-YIG superfamily endonuclease
VLKEPIKKTRFNLGSSPHQIYALIDPRDGALRYIGVSNNVNRRLAQHCRDTSKHTPKGRWLAELQQQGLTPELEIIETIEGEKTLLK